MFVNAVARYRTCIVFHIQRLPAIELYMLFLLLLLLLLLFNCCCSAVARYRTYICKRKKQWLPAIVHALSLAYSGCPLPHISDDDG